MLLDHLKNKHTGKPCYIIGKGESLNKLTPNHIAPDAVVITINQAIEKVESLNLPNKIYSLQKDRYTNHVKPDTHLLLHVHESAKVVFSKPEERFDNLELDLQVEDFSALTAIQIAKLMGCVKFYFVSFDSVTEDNYKVYGNKTKPPYWENYQIQSKKMKEFVKDLNHEWITPK